VQRLPPERLLQRDRTKDFESLQQSLKQKGLPVDTPTLSHATAISHAEPAHFGGQQPVPAKTVNSVGLDQKTLAYQDRLAYVELYLTEGQAKEDFMGCAVDIHSGFKHGLNLAAPAREIKSMILLPGL
jgi:hypothetical protein